MSTVNLALVRGNQAVQNILAGKSLTVLRWTPGDAQKYDVLVLWIEKPNDQTTLADAYATITFGMDGSGVEASIDVDIGVSGVAIRLPGERGNVKITNNHASVAVNAGAFLSNGESGPAIRTLTFSSLAASAAATITIPNFARKVRPQINYPAVGAGVQLRQKNAGGTIIAINNHDETSHEDDLVHPIARTIDVFNNTGATIVDGALTFILDA